MLEFLKKSEAYQEIRTEGRTEGLEEGRVEGLREGETQGVIRSILAILGARFGQLPQNFFDRLHELDVSRLSDLVVKAMSIESLAAFEALIQNLKEKTGSGSAKS